MWDSLPCFSLFCRLVLSHCFLEAFVVFAVGFVVGRMVSLFAVSLVEVSS